MSSEALQQRARPVIAVSALVLTAPEVLTGHASVWPAWVGLALAGVMAGAAAISYLAVPGERTPTTIAPYGPS